MIILGSLTLAFRLTVVTITTALIISSPSASLQAQTANGRGTFRSASSARMIPRAVPVNSNLSPAAAMGYLDFDGRYASAPVYMPIPVRVAVASGNELQDKPYLRGGGHGQVHDKAYDCSGSVSYCLIQSGLLTRPLSSKEFAGYGLPGPGRFITIFVKPGEHVFMSICGLRLDTSGGRERQGPRWRGNARSMAGFTMRHPFGL
jgi:hypothetical protein